ncbi:energy-coupling factor transport system ATP-binding protein [Desulfonispora thiosulfatigenes DSM 11270]|uniref:Energy-coupling factor transport system ATP-binding protein n=1 Tax=Desulfonispora thiosulfatigenes DSM 11270 TaxID=656914 RepID=A0A1W1URJ9_DESTI|nr:energy-coupling factor transporter ATPase [Desulfonispora thiosulfatigenes]SMB83663.1 energy-coupling factor transport system ATP-binding protein [Desulfonispora thiosulfatigenes DSM 11270]
MIEIRNLTHKYISVNDHTTTAVDNMDISIKSGEFVVILGHNGSGKSTLSKHLNALLLPSEGQVLINSLNTSDESKLWDIRQQVGMVFQNPDNQIIATIVEEDVAFGPENLGIEPIKIRQRVDEALKMVDMYEFRDKAPHLLSGGQKQRIAIAGIIAMRPKCLVLDEPTAMLDPSGRKEVMETIVKLNKEEGLTIVHITHYMEEAVLADRVIVMEAGKVVLEGKPKDVFLEIETLKDLRLDVPPITELAVLLNKELPNISRDILTIDEMVNALCP